MTSPNAADADAADQRLSAAGDDPQVETPELREDAPEADTLEQARTAGPGEHRTERETPLEADEADAVEQAVVVPLDEDEGRD